MDRKLTDNEKTEYRKKFGPPKKSETELARLSYLATIKWGIIILFLFTPMLVDYGMKNLSIANVPKLAAGVESKDEAILQVYAARTWGPKGIFAVHSWIAMKRPGSEAFEVSQVIGWRRDRRGNVLFRETNVPVTSWHGNEGELLLDLRGDDVVSIMDKVDAAISEYPWKKAYTLYPGPNSNTFVAWIGLQVPEMGLDLPSTAIGKDWRPLEHALGLSASGTGFQASLLGLLGTSIGFEEGLEINVLSLNFEIDIFDLALEIPLFGRYEIWYLIFYLTLWFCIKRWVPRT